MREDKGKQAAKQGSGQKAGIEIILLEKTDGGQFSKTIELSEDGQSLVTHHAPDKLVNMAARRVKMGNADPLGELQKVIDGIKPEQSFALGRMPAMSPDDKTLPIKLVGQPGTGKHGEDWMHRDGWDTAYAAGVPAPVLLDFDIKDFPDHIKDKVEQLGGPFDALLSAVPVLRDQKMIVRPSTSSGIQRVADGYTFEGGGQHAYLMLSDGSRSAEFLRKVQDHLWVAGLGFVKVTKGGGQMMWSIIDTTAGRSDRPCYEAAPVLGKGLSRPFPKCQVHRGTTQEPFDVSLLPEVDRAVVGKLYDEAKAQPEVQVLVEKRAREKEDELVAQGYSQARAHSMVASLRDSRKVPLSMQVVPVLKEKGTPMIIDLLEKPGKWNLLHMADPMEGPSYNPNNAVFYANDDGKGNYNPKINTFAHGPGVYPFTDYGVQDAVEAVQDGLEPDRVAKVLELSHGDVLAVLRALRVAGVDVADAMRVKLLKEARARWIMRLAKVAASFAADPWNGEPEKAGFAEALEYYAEGKQLPDTVQGPGRDEAVVWLHDAVLRMNAREAVLGADGATEGSAGFSIQPIGMDVLLNEQPAPKMLYKGLFPRAACSIVGPGESSKTTLAINIAIRTILGLEIWGVQPEITGPVVFFSAEDKLSDFAYLVHETCKAMMLTPEQQQKVAEKLHIKCMSILGGVKPRLLEQDKQGNLQPTEDAKAMLKACQEIKPVMVIFDPVSQFGAGERFINDGEAALMLWGASASEALDDACVMFIHHVSQVAGREQVEDQYAGRGGSAFGDNGRGGMTFYRHRADSSIPLPQGITEFDVEDERVLRGKAVKLNKDRKVQEHLFVLRKGFQMRFIRGVEKPRNTAAKLSAEKVSSLRRMFNQEKAVLKKLDELLANGAFPNKTSLRGYDDIVDTDGRAVAERKVGKAIDRLTDLGVLTPEEAPNAPKKPGAKPTYLKINDTKRGEWFQKRTDEVEVAQQEGTADAGVDAEAELDAAGREIFGVDDDLFRPVHPVV